MLLPTETNTILEKRCYKRYAVRSSCFGGCKIVFALLIEVIADYMNITYINVKKKGLEKIFTETLYCYKSGFYYYLNDILYILIYINFLLSIGVSKNGYQYIEKLLKWSLGNGKLISISKI